MDYQGTESDETVVAAAWTLVSIKHSKLDQDTAEKLQEMKRIVSQKVRDESRVPTRIIYVSKESAKSRDQTRMINVVTKRKRLKSGKSNVVSKHQRSKSRKSNQPSTESPGLVLPARPPFAELQDFIGSCIRPFQKQITWSDVQKHFSRFMLNSSFCEDHLKPMLDRNVEIIEKGIRVTVYGPGGRDYAMTLKIWSEKYYVLKDTTWIRFCEDYDLESFIDHWATVWMFRHNKTNGLCFAITWSN